MKYFILSFSFFTIITSQAFSQIEKKTMLVGGNASATFSTAETSFFIFNPSAGIFVNDKVCLGASAPLMFIDETFYWGINPFARYYFSPKKSQSLFTSVSVGLSNYNYNLVSTSLGIGNVWFINKSVGFETELVGSTDFEDISVGIFLGLQVYLNKSNK